MFTLLAPAKINLHLRVLYKRPDGYHEIESVIQAVSLFDRLTFSPAAKIDVQIKGARIPQKDNLVTKALTLLQEYSGTRKGLRVMIEKKIPGAAGLGGGSSDAASALLGACFAWRLPLSISELSFLGAQIGSDVPFFFTSGQALAKGRGEKLQPLILPTGYELLLACPDFPVPTPWAYGALNLGLTTGKGKDTFSTIRHSEVTGEDLRLSPRVECFSNDLEAPVFGRFPEVQEIKKILRSAGLGPVLMSGSGPAVWAAFPNKGESRGLPEKNIRRRATMAKIRKELGAKVRLWTLHPLAACHGQPVGGQPL
jgi:4-diphosphocytidyl-2-C-methyl-D-erythritol kinase